MPRHLRPRLATEEWKAQRARIGDIRTEVHEILARSPAGLVKRQVYVVEKGADDAAGVERVRHKPPGPPRQQGEQHRASNVASPCDATSQCWLSGPRPRSGLGR